MRKPLQDKRLFLLDMDGTIYKGSHLFEGTVPFLKKVREIGGRVLYLTNNSSKSAGDYREKLERLGIASKKEDFVTSTMVTAEYLMKRYPGRLFYVLGTESFVQELFERGVRVTTAYSQQIDGLVIGFDTQLTFQKLEDASRLLTRDLPYVAANPDWCCPTEFGAVPDCGSIAQMLCNATGKTPVFLGKPEPEIVWYAMRCTGCKPEETLLIGDRMYTDIKGGINAKVDTALVLSGETSRRDLANYDYQPDYVFENLEEIMRLF